MAGKAFKYPNNVDTDVILPARYLALYKEEDLAKHCMEDIDAEFVSRVQPGDYMLGGENFGCGSSREHAPIAIKACGIHCVIAKSFARIFYRNAINIGLPILECPQAVADAEPGDEFEAEPEKGIIKNITKNKAYQTGAMPSFIKEMVDAGGLLRYLSQKR